MDWGGILVGAAIGFVLSAVLWAVQLRLFVPRLKFADKISKLSDEDGPVYRVKMMNASRYRGIIDLQVEVRVWSRLRTAVNTRRVLSERRRRFPQVLPDDEGGLRRETHRTAIGGDTSGYRQAAVEGDGR